MLVPVAPCRENEVDRSSTRKSNMLGLGVSGIYRFHWRQAETDGHGYGFSEQFVAFETTKRSDPFGENFSRLRIRNSRIRVLGPSLMSKLD